MRVITVVFPEKEDPLAIVLPFVTVVKPKEYICWAVYSFNPAVGRISIQFASSADTFFFGSDKSGDHVLMSSTYNPSNPNPKLNEVLVFGQAPEAMAKQDCKYTLVATNSMGGNPKLFDPKIIIDGP